MGRSIAAAAVGGLGGGIVLAGLMRILPVTSGHESMLGLTARALAIGPMAAWLVYPVYGLVIGALFGWMLRSRTADDFSAVLWGTSYGLLWWIIAGVALIPALLGIWPFSTVGLAEMRNVAVPLLIGHVVYGVILGVVWGRGTQRPRRPAHKPAADSVVRRAA